MRKTKIIATLGPATSTLKSIKEIVLAGANVLRINASHGVLEENQQKVNLVKQLRKSLQIPLPLVLDTRGPEIRIGDFEKGKVELVKGKTFTFTANQILGNETIVSLQQPQIIKNIKVGNTILACNGLITFKVIEKTETDLVCKIRNNGAISNKKSLFIPNVEYNIPYLNEKDKADILWAIKNGVEFIAASFVNKKEDVIVLKEFLKANGGNQEIIAKIESKLSIKNIDEIIEHSDAVMVARGDLGVEIPQEKLPDLQKNIIKKCLRSGIPVITATEMLESMISSPRPTRAETSDVANAVYDGTSAVMLSGETAVGKFPAKTVDTMSRIAKETEKSINYYKRYEKHDVKSTHITDIMSDAAVHVSFLLKDSKAIIAYTDTGHTAKMVSRFNPICPVIALTPNEDTYHRLNLARGVIPVLTKQCTSADQLLQATNKELKQHKLAKVGDMVLIGTGSRIPSSTDMIKIHIIT